MQLEDASPHIGIRRPGQADIHLRNISAHRSLPRGYVPHREKDAIPKIGSEEGCTINNFAVTPELVNARYPVRP